MSTTYKRQILGTAFILLLIYLEMAFIGVYLLALENPFFLLFLAFTSVEFNPKEVLGPFLLAVICCLFKIAFHMWILYDPKITAGKGNALKLNIFLGVCLLLNAIFISIGLTRIDQPLYALLLFISSLPGFFAIIERFIYGTSDDSICIFKYLKPFAAEVRELQDADIEKKSHFEKYSEDFHRAAHKAFAK